MKYLKKGDPCPEYIRAKCPHVKSLSPGGSCLCSDCDEFKFGVCVHCPIELIKEYDEFIDIAKLIVAEEL